MAEPETNDPRVQTRKMEKFLKDAGRPPGGRMSRWSRIHAPELLFETAAAEVITGLEKAFHDYDKKDELAWG